MVKRKKNNAAMKIGLGETAAPVQVSPASTSYFLLFHHLRAWNRLVSELENEIRATFNLEVQVGQRMMFSGVSRRHGHHFDLWIFSNCDEFYNGARATGKKRTRIYCNYQHISVYMIITRTQVNIPKSIASHTWLEPSYWHWWHDWMMLWIEG